MNTGVAGADGVTGRLGEALDADEPLQAQARLDGHAGARIVPDAVAVRAALLDDPALRAQLLADGLARREPVQAVKSRTAVGDDAGLVHDRRHRQAMPASDLEVVRVVRRGDLECAGAERRVDVVVRDHRDVPAGDRHADGAPHQVAVALVVRVHRDRGVAQHRLHARGRNDDRVVAVPVPDRDEFPLDLAVVDLDVADRALQRGRPVHEALGPVDEPVVEHLLEDGLDRAGEPVVQREALAAPVDALAEPADLAEDRPARLRLPLPHAGDERLAAHLPAPRLARIGELALDDALRGDARVVHPGQVQSVVALHAAASGERVDQGVVHGVPEVQAARDVRRRNDDAVGRLVALRIRLEVPALQPPLVQPSLYLARDELGGQVTARWVGVGHLAESTSRPSPATRRVLLREWRPTRARSRYEPARESLRTGARVDGSGPVSAEAGRRAGGRSRAPARAGASGPRPAPPP